MLKNDPPPATKVRLTTDIRTPSLRNLKAYEPGELVRTLQPWTGVDRAEDRFVVRFAGEEFVVTRDLIERAG